VPENPACRKKRKGRAAVLPASSEAPTSATLRGDSSFCRKSCTSDFPLIETPVEHGFGNAVFQHFD
jgi:hypothetical protein